MPATDDPSTTRALLIEARRWLMNWDDDDSDTESYAVRQAARDFLRDKLTPYLTPPPPTPLFSVGDPVWSFNGQKRVVTGMTWAQAMRRTDEPLNYEPPWVWFVDTVDPDDPKCKGCGSEDTYRPRVEGVTEPSLAEAYWAQMNGSKEAT